MAVRINRIVVYLKAILRILSVSAGVALIGCGGFESTDVKVIPSPVDVVLAVGDTPGTRTEYDVSARRFVWRDGDQMAVWAKASDGTLALDSQPFRLLASGAGHRPGVDPDNSSAYFTGTLPSAMEEGTYSYYMTYPLPESVGGTTATFTVPAVQDGLASGGVDVLVAEPVTGPALSAVMEGAPVDDDNLLKVRMKHLLHFLRFYIPEGNNVLGEPVKRIEFTMPQAVAGKVSVDVTDASATSLGEGVNGMTLELRKPIDESADGTDVAVAGIFPPLAAYSAGDQIAVDVYSENKCSSVSLSLAGRDFAAGHTTKVPLRMTEAKPIEYELKFMLASNNLGEDVQNIKITLPDNEVWPGMSSSGLRIGGDNGGFINIGDSYVFRTQDKAFFMGLSSKRLAVTYESESAVVSETVTLGDLSSSIRGVCELDCPYLFSEDFSGVEDFSSHDEFSKGTQVGTNFGNYDAHVFLDGWSAARAGAQACTSIRLSCRREASSDYSARADSPFLSGMKDGKTVDLSIQFDYSMDREEYAFLVSKPNAKQTVYCGFITTSDNLGSNSKVGTFPESFVVDETAGSYSNIDKHYDYILNGVEAIRLSWRTIPVHVAGTTSSTCWLYIDNIKVKIKK